MAGRKGRPLADARAVITPSDRGIPELRDDPRIKIVDQQRACRGESQRAFVEPILQRLQGALYEGAADCPRLLVDLSGLLRLACVDIGSFLPKTAPGAASGL